MSIATTNTKQLHILVEIMHGLGDTVCALALLKGIRYLYPEANITVLCKMNAGRDIIESSGILIEEIIVIDVYKSFLKTLKTLQYLRKQHFDIGISAGITPVKKSQLFMKLCGVKQHIGFQATGTNKFDYDMHFVEANLKTLGLDFEERFRPNLHIDSDSDAFIDSYFKNFDRSKAIIGICIGDADPTLKNRWSRTGHVYPKSWGIMNVHNLIKLLLEQDYQIVLIGGQQEIKLLEHLKEFINNANIVNLVGKCNIKQSMAAVKRCTCSVGVDTGMQHIAAALIVPTISIFGPTNPKHVGAFSEVSYFIEHNESCKYCFGTKAYISCKDRKCLRGITSKEVFDMVNYLVEIKAQ